VFVILGISTPEKYVQHMCERATQTKRNDDITKQYLLGVRNLSVDRHEHAVGQDDQHDEEAEERNGNR